MILILKDRADSTTDKTVRLLVEKIATKGVDVEVANFAQDVEFFLEEGNVRARVKGAELSDYGMVFVRKAGSYRNAAFALSRVAKQDNVCFLDKQWEKFFAPGKFQQMLNLALDGVAIPKTYYAPEYAERHLENAISYLNFPIVVKLSVSKKGIGVFLAKSKEELQRIVAEGRGKEMIFQEFIQNDFDYRILILGKQVGVAEKRTRTAKDEFRNNVFLGAEEEFLALEDVPTEVGAVALAAARTMDIQVAGVDVVVREDGRACVFEVNRTPAFTLDEKISNELEKLTEYIILCSTKKQS